MENILSKRPRCSAFIAMSIDGYIARPDGGIDWLSIVEQPGEDYGYQRFFDAVDALILGRKTYDTVLGLGGWPYADKRCVVLTHSPPAVRHGEEFFTGSPAALVARLGQQGARRLYIDGGTVIRQFLAAQLLDDMTLSVVPIVLGSGRRLFAGGEPEQRWVLEESRCWPTGLVQLRYCTAEQSTRPPLNP